MVPIITILKKNAFEIAYKHFGIRLFLFLVAYMYSIYHNIQFLITFMLKVQQKTEKLKLTFFKKKLKIILFEKKWIKKMG